MKKYSPYILSSLLVLGCASVNFILSGCWAAVGAGAGAGTVAYIDGSIKDNLDTPIENAHQATLKACSQLQYTVISESKDAQTVEVVARDAKDEKIKINLTRLTDKATEIKIRIGVFGDQMRSIDLLEEIKKSLK